MLRRAKRSGELRSGLLVGFAFRGEGALPFKPNRVPRWELPHELPVVETHRFRCRWSEIDLRTGAKYPDRIPNYLPYAGWSGFATKARSGAGGLGDRAAGAVGAGCAADLMKAASAGSCGAYLRTIFGVLG